jgi:putative tryptophan/tyrosine transport system substrate-binding protein
MEEAMRRQIGFCLLAIVLLTVSSGEAQQPAKLPTIGLLGAASASSYAPFVEAFRQGMHDRGYVEGKNVAVEYRWAEGKYDRLPDLAAELVRLKVDVIVTHGTPGTLAAKQATATIPIVMTVVGDPVGSGLVASLARPGGNITGTSIFAPELGPKRLELLKEALPRVSRVAVLWNADNPINGPTVKSIEKLAQTLKTQLQEVQVREPSEFDKAFSSMVAKRADALLVLEDAMLNDQAKQIADRAAKSRLPTVFGFGGAVDVGGLMAYEASWPDLWRRSATFVDKIFKGAKPAELPVEQASKFQLVINLKTAKQIGVTIPQSFLFRADKVIK